MSAIDPGRFFEEITIDTQSNTADGAGGYTTSWTSSATIRAQVEVKDAAYALADGSIRHEQLYVITIRKNAATLTSIGSQRITWGGEQLNILSFKSNRQEDRGRYWIITCSQDDGDINE